MSIQARLLLAVFCPLALTLAARPAVAQLGTLQLFPGPSAITDGSAGDDDGAVNDEIKIDPTNPILVPNGNGIKFYGDVIWNSTPATGGQIGSASLTVTNAAFINDTNSSVPAVFELALREHAGYAPGPVNTTAEIDGEINTTDNTTHNITNNRFLFIRAFDNAIDYPSNFQSPPWPLNSPPVNSPLAEWQSSGTTIPPAATPLTFSDTDTVGPTPQSGVPGEFRLRVADLRLGANEEFILPNSIDGQSVVPEPGSLALLGISVIGLVAGRRRA